MGLLLAAALVVLQAPDAPTSIAVTRDGVRIEAIEPAVGDLSLRTPLGILSTPLDPVVAVVDGREQLYRLTELHEAGFLDDEALLRDLSTAGQLTALADRAAKLQASNPYTMVPYEVLESWAQRIDPVPSKISQDMRVPWLWEQACDREFVPAVIAGWRLPMEVSSGSQVSRHRNITESTLARDGFDSTRPWARRTAAFVAGKQHSPLLRQHLLEYSLSDASPAVRRACALECQRTMAHAARQFWVMNLMRSDGLIRESAALNLGRFGGPEGQRALLYALSAWDQKAPEQYVYHGRKIWLRKEYLRELGRITDKRHHYHPGQSAIAAWGDSYLFAPDAEFERIDLGTRLKIPRSCWTRWICVKAKRPAVPRSPGCRPSTTLTSRSSRNRPAAHRLIRT
jgi:hypothetical protein